MKRKERKSWNLLEEKLIRIVNLGKMRLSGVELCVSNISMNQEPEEQDAHLLS